MTLFSTGSWVSFSAGAWARCCFTSRTTTSRTRPRSSPSGRAACPSMAACFGVFVAMLFIARKYGRRWLEVTDFIAPLVPLKRLAAGRLGNFINGELWGRPADPSLPWAMIFPQVDALPRHPSQLYQMAGGDYLVRTAVALCAEAAPRRRCFRMFMIGYGLFRLAPNISGRPMPAFWPVLHDQHGPVAVAADDRHRRGVAHPQPRRADLINPRRPLPSQAPRGAPR